MSTPLDKIPDDPHRSLDEDQQLVQTIMKEIKQHESGAQPEAQMDLQQEYEEEPQQRYQSMPGEPTSHSEPQYYEQAEPEYTQPTMKPPQKSFFQKLLNESKDPIIVLVLYIAFGLPILDRLLVKSIPRLMTTAGNLCFTGVICKGILLTLFFFVIKKFVK